LQTGGPAFLKSFQISSMLLLPSMKQKIQSRTIVTGNNVHQSMGPVLGPGLGNNKTKRRKSSELLKE